MKRRGSREKPPHGVLGLVGYTHALLGCDSLPHALARHTGSARGSSLTVGRKPANRRVSETRIQACGRVRAGILDHLFSITFVADAGVCAHSARLARLLHYSKAKGGCHENQDEGEGGTERPHSELKNNRNKSARSHTAGGFSSYT